MVTAQRLTFEQYLEQNNRVDQRYELVDGRLTPMMPKFNRQNSGNLMFT